MRKLQTKWSRICGQLRDVVTPRCTAASASACWRPMEPLEPRLLLTSVDVTLVSVLTPSPDDSSVLPSPITHVSVGDTYFLEVWMQDVSAGVGITGGQVDLLYSTTPADAIAVVNDDFDLFASDGIDDALGVVDNLGGGSLASGLGVTPDFARLAYVEMQATAEGNTTFSLAPGSLRFALFGLGNIEFSEVDLTDTIAVFHKPPIGESGQVTNLTHVLQTVVMSRSYANPVVFAQSPSYNGIEEAVVRVTNVQSNQFAMFMQEPSNLNGTHIEESVSYVVLEAGQWQLPNGEMLEVGTLDTSSTVGRRQPSPQWETMAFANAFGGIPVVLSQVQTTNDASFVKTRQNSLTTDSFDVALEGEEIDTTQHGLETIGYMALDAGTGQWGSITYEGFVTPTVFTDAGSTLTFSHSFSQAPNFLSSLSTHNGQDPSELRYSNLTGTGAQIFVEEDTTFDTEKIHIAEGFSYLALDGNGLLVGDPLVTAPTSVGEVGRITNLTHVAQVISLQRTYLNPVVFTQSPSLNGAQPVVVRISDVQANQFTVFLQEPSNLDGTHIAETVSYTVFEAGRWQLPNGALLEVGSLSSSATVGSQLNSPQWQTLSFVNAFPAVPVILSQVQTNNDASFVKTRQNNALAGGFQIAMEGEESATQPHGTETIGYLALEAGSGLWSGIAYEGFNTSAVFTDVSSILSFNQIFSGAPSLLSSLSTYNGGDSSELRYDNLTTTNVQVRVEEDTTFDAEVGHTSEALSYLAFAGTGFLQGQVLGPALADPSVGTLELVTSADYENVQASVEAAADPATGPSSSSQFLRGVAQAAQITASANKSMLFAASQRWATKQSVQLDRTQTPWMDQLLLSTRGDAADGPIESLVQIV